MTSKEPLILPAAKTQVQVRFSDTDMMGHISSASYATWGEVGRIDFFMQIPEPAEEIPWFVLVHLGLDFHHEGHFGQHFELDTRCIDIGTKSLTIQHQIHADENLVCTIKVVMSAFDRKTRQSVEVPKHWRVTES